MKCPFCDEEILENAQKCRYCKEWIVRPENPAVVEAGSEDEHRKDYATSRRLIQDIYNDSQLRTWEFHTGGGKGDQPLFVQRDNTTVLKNRLTLSVVIDLTTFALVLAKRFGSNFAGSADQMVAQSLLFEYFCSATVMGSFGAIGKEQSLVLGRLIHCTMASYFKMPPYQDSLTYSAGLAGCKTFLGSDEDKQFVVELATSVASILEEKTGRESFDHTLFMRIIPPHFEVRKAALQGVRLAKAGKRTSGCGLAATTTLVVAACCLLSLLHS